MTGLRFDAGEPRSHAEKPVEIEPPFIGDMGVGIERNVGDGVTLVDKERPAFQLLLHDGEGAVAAIHL